MHVTCHAAAHSAVTSADSCQRSNSSLQASLCIFSTFFLSCCFRILPSAICHLPYVHHNGYHALLPSHSLRRRWTTGALYSNRAASAPRTHTRTHTHAHTHKCRSSLRRVDPAPPARHCRRSHRHGICGLLSRTAGVVLPPLCLAALFRQGMLCRRRLRGYPWDQALSPRVPMGSSLVATGTHGISRHGYPWDQALSPRVLMYCTDSEPKTLKVRGQNDSPTNVRMTFRMTLSQNDTRHSCVRMTLRMTLRV